MKPFKAKYTECVLRVAGKFPFFFTRRLQFRGESFLRSKKDPSSKYEIQDQEIKYASLFSERMVWKGVSLVGAISQSDLRKIHKWIKNQKSSAMNYHGSHDRSVESTDLVSSGWSNFGLISFGPEYIGAVGKISLLAMLPQGCYVTILKLPKGVIYLSLYILLDKEASDRVFDVDVRGVESHVCFQSLNPLSPRFSVTEHHSRDGLGTRLVSSNARAVVEEACQAATAVLQVCGINKDIKSFAAAIDICRDGKTPYFKEYSGDYTYDAQRNVIYEPHRGRFLVTKVCDDDTEEYLENYISSELGVDGVFIKTEDFSKENVYGKYLNSMHSAAEYYTYFLYVSEVYRSFKRCMVSASPVFSAHKNSSRKSLKVLIEVSLQLNLVEERLTALQEGIRWSDKKYWSFTENRIKTLSEKVKALRGDVDRRKELNNSELQLSNLVWTKRYSLLVLFLVVVQIALSMLNVDWSEAGRDKNPVYINLVK